MDPLKKGGGRQSEEEVMAEDINDTVQVAGDRLERTRSQDRGKESKEAGEEDDDETGPVTWASLLTTSKTVPATETGRDTAALRGSPPETDPTKEGECGRQG